MRDPFDVLGFYALVRLTTQKRGNLDLTVFVLFLQFLGGVICSQSRLLAWALMILPWMLLVEVFQLLLEVTIPMWLQQLV